MLATIEKESAVSGERMSYWIARVLQRARTRAEIHERTMAELMDVDARTIRRWEAGDSFGRRTELDRAVAGYAYVLGLEDGRDLWEEAITWWREEGSPPEWVPQATTSKALADAIRAVRVEAMREEMRREGRDSSARSRAHDGGRNRRTVG